MKCSAAVAFSPIKKAKASVDYSFSVTIEVTKEGIEVMGFKGKEQRICKVFTSSNISNMSNAVALAIDLAGDEDWIPIEQDPDAIHSFKELGEAMKAIKKNTMPNQDWLDMKMRIDAFLAEANLEVVYIDPDDLQRSRDYYVLDVKGEY